jgi:hypothetical protein
LASWAIYMRSKTLFELFLSPYNYTHMLEGIGRLEEFEGS